MSTEKQLQIAYLRGELKALEVYSRFVDRIFTELIQGRMNDIKHEIKTLQNESN